MLDKKPIKKEIQRGKKPMTADTIKDEIKSRLADYLDTVTQSRGRNIYNCPICGSGTGAKGTPAFSVTGDMWKCFSCGNGGDIFNLIALLTDRDIKTEFSDIVKIGADALYIPYSTDNTRSTQYTHNKYNACNQSKAYNANNTAAGGNMYNGTKATETEQKQPRKDYREYIAQCHAAAGGTDFFSKRGITADSVERFRLGYDAAKKQAVFPYDVQGTYYIARSTEIDADAPNNGAGKHYKPKTAEAGKEPIYNRAALDHAADSESPVFICEAPIDAISIMQAGGIAVAIGGTGQPKLTAYLDSLLAKGDFTAPLVIATDSDDPGRKAAAAIAADLDGRNLVYTYLEYPQEMHEKTGKVDANSFLMADAEQFKAAVLDAQKRAADALEAKAAKDAAEYNAKSAAARLDSFISKWDAGRYNAIKTGFPALDQMLDGGLYPGLYAIGAISSLGKTTFTLQIADQLAAAGYDVLFFSLEMAADELTAKTLSRLTAQISKEKEREYNKTGQTNRALTNPERRKFWKQTSAIHTVTEAEARYKEFGQNIFIVEGLGDISAAIIRDTVKQHIRARRKAPVVVIDYVQIMDAYGERLTDKQNMDKNIVELKRISRDYNTPVIAISSFNRDNYTSAVNMAAFKESGAIEYTSDVVIALQPQGMAKGGKPGSAEEKENIKRVDACKNSTLRELEAVILKHRNGGTGTVLFDYYTLFNLYEDKGIKPKEQQQPQTRTKLN